MKRTLLILALLCALPAVGQIPKPLATGTIQSQATSCQVQSGSPACVFLQIDSQISQVAIQIAGSYSGTLQFEWSVDGGNTWVSLTSTPNGGGTGVTSTTSTGVWTAQVGGGSYVRVRCSSYSSGVALVTLNPSSAAAPGGNVSSSGVVNPNSSTFTNPFAAYVSNGGSTTVGPSTDFFDLGSGNVGVGGVGIGNGGYQASGSTSGTIVWGCNANACTSWTTASPVQTTSNNGISAKHLNQIAANNFAGTCTMSAGTTCTATINLTYSTPICFAGVQSAAPTTFQGSCALSGTTVTVTASAANSNSWAFVVMGNPN